MNLLEVFREVKRVLRNDGTLWLNIGDSYGSGARKTSKTQTNMSPGKSRDLPLSNRGKQGWAKQLVGIPWKLAFALQADGWYLRQDIIWAKTNPMPESVKDRCTRSHEYLFLLTKSRRYYFDYKALLEPGITLPNGRVPTRGKEDWSVGSAVGNPQQDLHQSTGTRQRRDVWFISTEPTPEAHFATFPKKLIEPCILAGSRKGDVVLDPFIGSGTTAIVAESLGRGWVGVELSKDYVALAKKRIRKHHPEIVLEL